jgi:Glucose-6-phosphate dehydrogenase, C-terminal domain
VSFDLRAVHGGSPLPPYSSLIHDVLVGDRSLFTSSEGLAKARSAVQPLLDRRPEVRPYPAGGTGPAADQLPSSASASANDSIARPPESLAAHSLVPPGMPTPLTVNGDGRNSGLRAR